MRAPITIFEAWPAGDIEAGDAGEAATMDEAAQIVRECGYRVKRAIGDLNEAGTEIAAFSVIVEPPGESKAG